MCVSTVFFLKKDTVLKKCIYCNFKKKTNIKFSFAKKLDSSMSVSVYFDLIWTCELHAAHNYSEF